jgi:hypothetical protein
MPSHADRVRRNYEDAEPDEKPPPVRPIETLKHRSELERYAGWLSRDHVSVAVRADVHALGAAMDAGLGTSQLLLTLAKDIARLPSGGVRKMLQKAFAEISIALAPMGVDAADGEAS